MFIFLLLCTAVSYFAYSIFILSKPDLDDLDRTMALLFGAALSFFTWPFFVIIGLAYLTKKKFFSGVEA